MHAMDFPGGTHGNKLHDPRSVHLVRLYTQTANVPLSNPSSQGSQTAQTQKICFPEISNLHNPTNHPAKHTVCVASLSCSQIAEVRASSCPTAHMPPRHLRLPNNWLQARTYKHHLAMCQGIPEVSAPKIQTIFR